MKNKFLEFISSNFNKIKNQFKNNIVKEGLQFDEDIFSDTIIKCNEKFNKQEDYINTEVMGYFWCAFKYNTLRDLKYMKNKKTTHEIPMETPCENEEYDIYEVFNEVSKMIINQFGNEMYRLFTLHANGMSYKKLETMTDITNLKYKFRQIREYIRENYNKEP